MNKILEQYRNRLIQKRYSKNTILQNIIPEQINTYILKLIETKNVSISQQNQRINAIKFYYEKIL